MDTQLDKKPTPHLVAVDILVFTVIEDELKVALILRGIEPYKGQWALPGGFVREDESVDQAALREVREETGVKRATLDRMRQLQVFGELKRDPYRRVISVAYYALVNEPSVNLVATTDAAEVAWHPAHRPPAMPFDHNKILDKGIARLKGDIKDSAIASCLLPPEFRLSEFHRVYEAVLHRRQPIDKPNFRRMWSGILVDTGKTSRGDAHRPAKLFRFRDPTQDAERRLD